MCVPNEAYFFVNLETYKKPTFGKKEQNDAFRTGAKIYFSEEKEIGLVALEN